MSVPDDEPAQLREQRGAVRGLLAPGVFGVWSQALSA